MRAKRVLNMKTLSTCLIIKDEENKLEKCLKSIQSFSDEIIVVDTGSTDSSMEIAKQYTDRIYQVPWQNDFSIARDESYRHATMDYLLWFDADNYIDENNAEKMIRLKEHLTDENSVFLLLMSDELQRPRWDHRITRRNPNLHWKYPVHEQFPIRAPIRMEPIVIRHLYRGMVNNMYPELLKKIPEREIFSQFWLCAQCYHDYLRCGYKAEAQTYLEKLMKTQWELSDYLSPAEDFGNVLSHYGYYKEAMFFYRLLLESEELKRQDPVQYLRILKRMDRCRKESEKTGENG